MNETRRDVPVAGSPAGSLTEVGLIGRITALARAFRGFAERVPGLSVSVVGTLSGRSDLVHPVAGFEVGLAGAGGAAVSLYVSSSYGELRRPLASGGRTGVLRETFQVRLSDGFEWGGSAYPDADALAHDLLGYLQYQLDTHR